MWAFLQRLLGGAPPPAPVADDAPGWDAVEAAFTSRYGEQRGHWTHTGVHAMHDLRTPPEYPLDGITAWDGGAYWRYVGLGMSELYAKDWDDLAVSGWGYELGLRLAKAESATEPPAWVCSLLQQLCRAQFTRPTFEAGHTLATGPLEPGSPYVGYVIAADPDVGPIDTPHGRVTFLLLVAVDAETLERATGGHRLEVLESLRHAGFVTTA